MNKPPKTNSREWIKNEKTINQDPGLKAARDISQGFKPKPGQTHGGKGSARRGSNDAAYEDGWDRIWGKKKKDE